MNSNISAQLDLNYYLRENAPDVMRVMKIKLCKSLEIGDGKYRMWKRNTKGKVGGVLLMAKKKENC